MKIVICGGHLTPALALIEELEKENGVEIIFFGRKTASEGSQNISAEYKLITERKIKFIEIITGRLQRKFTRYTIISLAKIPVGFFQSLYFLLSARPNLVVSFGGYLSIPAVFAAWLLGINSIIHEQAVIPGLANKINSNFAKRIFLSWESSSKYFHSKKHKIAVIGNLVRSSLIKSKPKSKTISTFLNYSKKLLFITGGNQGSHFLNQLIVNSLEKLSDYEVIHQVGTMNHRRDLEIAQKIKIKNYLAIPYIESSDFGAIIRRSHLVISRSGANTVWELAVFAKPAILVPLPISASNEQMENARVLENANMAKIIIQDDCSSDKLISTINSMDKNYIKYQKASQYFSKTLPKGAVKELSNYILSYK